MKISGISGTVTLNNGVAMPYFGLGVFKMDDGAEVYNTVTYAIKHGYRHFDTAAMYGNEKGVGKAVKECGLPREQFFITSKVWNSDQGYDSTLRAFDQSMKNFGFGYLDLYLVHWPVKGKYKETWKALETINSEGRAKAVGVSNFLKHHIDDVMQTANIVPAVNQVEFHPYLVQQDLVDYCHSLGIQYQAWSPLVHGRIIEDKNIQQIARKYNKTVVQVVLRWDLQKGVVTIPKSVKPERILSNAQIFDFELSDEDMRLIDSLDRSERIGAHPDYFDF